MATIDIFNGPVTLAVKEVGFHSETELKVVLSHNDSCTAIYMWVPKVDSHQFFLGREFNVTIEPKPIVPPPDSRQMLIPGTEEKPLTGGDSDVV